MIFHVSETVDLEAEIETLIKRAGDSLRQQFETFDATLPQHAMRSGPAPGAPRDPADGDQDVTGPASESEP